MRWHQLKLRHSLQTIIGHLYLRPRGNFVFQRCKCWAAAQVGEVSLNRVWKELLCSRSSSWWSCGPFTALQMLFSLTSGGNAASAALCHLSSRPLSSPGHIANTSPLRPYVRRSRLEVSQRGGVRRLRALLDHTARTEECSSAPYSPVIQVQMWRISNVRLV